MPLGIFSKDGSDPRIGVAIGEMILDLRALAAAGLVDEHWRLALSLGTLNAWFAHGPADATRASPPPVRIAVRRAAQRGARTASGRPALRAQMHLPCAIGDYTDFYVGIHHATNVGKQFRPDQPLLPNYKYVPIGYHGRASSVRVSGEPVIRPNGQRKPPDAEAPEYGPSRRLDYELELGIWVGRGNALGAPIPIAEAGEHIAGYCLLNDWSARDLQAWEYQPLGPFLAKNFLTSVSARGWSPPTRSRRSASRCRRAPPATRRPCPIWPIARTRRRAGSASSSKPCWSTAKMRDAGLPPHVLSRGEAAAAMYWSAAQIVTHHARTAATSSPAI